MQNKKSNHLATSDARWLRCLQNYRHAQEHLKKTKSEILWLKKKIEENNENSEEASKLLREWDLRAMNQMKCLLEIEEWLLTLDDAQAKLIEYRYFNALTWAQVSARMGRSKSFCLKMHHYLFNRSSEGNM